MRATTGAIAGGSLVFMVAILVFLLWESWPSVLFNGVHFMTSITWNIGNIYNSHITVHNGVQAPAGATYGILPFIVGTLLSSLIAIVLALPVAIGIALLLVEYLPRRFGSGISFVVELLAGVPSVVYGLWGLAVLIPWIHSDLGPAIKSTLGFIGFFGGPIGSGQGLLASGLVLAVMITPIIAATARDVLLQTPLETKQGALALGFTRWEMIRSVSLPWAASGVYGAAILGLGRALGETMAVLMVSGNAVNYLPHSIYNPISTMASTIVALLDSAQVDPTGMAIHALAEIALVLFVISVIVNVPARLLLMARARRGGGGVHA